MSRYFSQQGFPKGHGLLGNNPTSKGHHWKLSEETKKRMSDARKLLHQQRPELKEISKKNLKFIKSTKGIPRTDEVKMKVSLAKTGVRVPKLQGKNHWRWIEDRSKIIKRTKMDMKMFEYIQWRKEVFMRDNFKCKISDADCNGQLEAHHILPWRDYPKLHYQVNNGITLCHFHHPRKRQEEIRLSPYFQELISNKQ